MKILVVHSSSDVENSATRQVSESLVFGLGRVSPRAVVTRRDLARDPIPHFTASQAFAPGNRADALCEELLRADVVVVGAPMWNFSIPSVLKAWVDHVVRAGVTFRYGPAGPEGLLPSGKRLFIIESSGGDYETPEGQGLNHSAPYLRQIFSFLGISDTQTITIGGTAYRRELSIAEALKKVETILHSFPARPLTSQSETL